MRVGATGPRARRKGPRSPTPSRSPGGAGRSDAVSAPGSAWLPRRAGRQPPPDERLFPQHAGRPLVFASDSYGGHLVAAWAAAVLDFNRDAARRAAEPPLRLRGIALGSALLNATLQGPASSQEFRRRHGLGDAAAPTPASAKAAMKERLGYAPNVYDYRLRDQERPSPRVATPPSAWPANLGNSEAVQTSPTSSPAVVDELPRERTYGPNSSCSPRCWLILGCVPIWAQIRPNSTRTYGPDSTSNDRCWWNLAKF